MILSGHLHLSHVGRTAQRYPTQSRAALLIQAGTATSTRQRGEVNAFNIVRIAKPEADVACMVWDPERMTFRPDQRRTIRRNGGRLGPPERDMTVYRLVSPHNAAKKRQLHASSLDQTSWGVQVRSTEVLI